MSRIRNAALLGVIVLPIVIGGAAIERQSTRDGAHVFDQVLSLVSDRFVDTLQQNQLFEARREGERAASSIIFSLAFSVRVRSCPFFLRLSKLLMSESHGR